MASASNQCSVKVVRAILGALSLIGVVNAETSGALSEAVARNNQAIQLASEGRDDEAEQVYHAALSAASHYDLARARIATNLGELYRRQDRYRDAEQMFRSALQWRQRNLPPESVEVAYSLNNLGEIYRVEGRGWEARNLIDNAAHSLEHFHTDASGLPIVQSNLAVVLCGFGEFDRAEELLRSALLTYQKRRATPSREYGVSLMSLGQVLETKNQLEEAGQAYEQAMGIFENAGAPAKIELAAVLADRGELYQRMNRSQEARQTEERALEMLHSGADAVLRSQILRNLGNILAGGAKPADSVQYFERSLVIQEKTFGAEHPGTAALLLDYASATQRAGNKSLARKLRKRAQDLLARLSRQSPGRMTISLRDLRDDK
jgi:tetratricopeptide (TPR) repeat protein